MDKKVVEFSLDLIGEEICKVNANETPNYQLVSALLHIVELETIGEDYE